MGDTTPPQLVFLGPLGTYSHQAANDTFGDNVSYVERGTIKDVFEAVSPELPYAVIPQENAIFGSVIETLNILRTSRAGTDVFIRGEITLAIQHCLVARKGIQEENITRIVSHEQALGQCEGFLSEHFPNAVIEKVASTAGAAQVLSEEDSDDSHSAAICSALCTTTFEGLEVLYKGIQDKQDNHTRFYVLSHTLDDQLPPSNIKRELHRALVRVALAEQPASDAPVSEILGVMKPALYSHSRPLHLVMSTLLTTFGVPVIRIDRRPSLTTVPFEDVYFVELEELGSPHETAVTPNRESAWRKRVRAGIERVAAAGGEATILGIW